jgi:hypothetical protein
MALSKVDFNSINVTPAASKAIKFNSSNNGLETGDVGGSLVLIKTTTISSSTGDVSFIHGASDVVFDSTYKEYIFSFIDIHGTSDPGGIRFQGTTDGTNFNIATTSTNFRAYHAEDDSAAALAYATGYDQSQGTGFQYLTATHGNDNDQSEVIKFHIFEPSSTTFVKHYMARSNSSNDGNYATSMFTGGYLNTTSAVTGLKFALDSGNIESATIKMYGVA